MIASTPGGKLRILETPSAVYIPRLDHYFAFPSGFHSMMQML